MRSKFYHPDANKVDDANTKFIELKNAEEYLVNNYLEVKNIIKTNKGFFKYSNFESSNGSRPDIKDVNSKEYSKVMNSENLLRTHKGKVIVFVLIFTMFALPLLALIIAITTKK